VIIIELQEQLLVQEKELDERQNNLVAREDDVVVAERALGRVRMVCNAKHDWVNTILQDYRARLRASTASQ
jgi:hypothetical protein